MIYHATVTYVIIIMIVVIVLLLFLLSVGPPNGSDSDEEVDTEMIDVSSGPEKSGESEHTYHTYSTSVWVFNLRVYIFVV